VAASAEREKSKPPDGIDLTELHPEVAGRITEQSYEDAARGAVSRLWTPHPNRVVRALEERAATAGRHALISAFQELNRRLRLPDDTVFDYGDWELDGRAIFTKAGPKGISFRWLLRQRSIWGRIKDFLAAAGLAVARWLKRDKMITAARDRALTTWLSGFHGITEPEEIDELPKTYRGLDRDTENMARWAQTHAGENVRDFPEDAESSLRRTLLQSAEEKWDERKLQQKLFEDHAELNRNWRRMAITETNESYNQGWIAGRKPGERVRRLEMIDACEFCKKLDNEVFTVVDPAKEPKDGWTEIWAGKNNIGRSRSPRKRTPDGRMVRRSPGELWWPAAGAQHPHCRGSWEPEEVFEVE
jgi:hypothetical protein